jgi:hypothetical protein
MHHPARQPGVPIVAALALAVVATSPAGQPGEAPARRARRTWMTANHRTATSTTSSTRAYDEQHQGANDQDGSPSTSTTTSSPQKDQ